MSETDDALVMRARAGDRAAFEELIRRTSRLVYASLYVGSGRIDRVEDLVQETFLLAFRSLHGLADPAGFRTWLLAIAHNVLIDDARRSARQKRAVPSADMHLIPLAHLPAPEATPAEEAQRSELRERLLTVLRSLPAEYRLPLTLRYITGADYDSICEQLGLTNGALRGALYRGLQLLRKRLPSDLAAEFQG